MLKLHMNGASLDNAIENKNQSLQGIQNQSAFNAAPSIQNQDQ